MRRENFNHIIRGFLLVCLFGYVNAYGQDPLFIAIVESNKVLQNSVFQVQFELRNGNGNDFQPPAFSDFKVVGGPSTSSSTMIVNGQVSRSQSWTYSLLAHKAGNYTISPASIIAGRKKVMTKPVPITVVASEDIAASGTMGGTEAIRLVASVKNDQYYPGQQIVLEYKLLFTENVQTANTLSEDDYSDFFVQNFNSFSKEPTYETINGVTYISRIIKAVALFAHQSGNYQIDPLIMDIGINAPYPGNQGFFTMRRLHDVRVASQPLTIQIIPLPVDPSPADFSGAVGEYAMITQAEASTQISTDDDYSLRIIIQGDGDSRRWDPPGIVTDGDFEIYDPRILEDRMNDTEGGVLHTRTIEYILIPKQPGEYHIHVPFRFFNPELKDYETIHSDTINLLVVQGQHVPRYARTDTTGSNIPLPLKKVNNIRTDDRFWLSIPHLFLFGLLVTGTCWGAWVNYKRKRENAIPETERMRSIASQHARHQLDQLSKASPELADKDFFEKATEIYTRFLSDKFNIPYADLDTDKIKLRLEKDGVAPSLIERALHFFEQCLSVRYGGIPGGYTRDEMVHLTRDVIDALDSAVLHHT